MATKPGIKSVQPEQADEPELRLGCRFFRNPDGTESVREWLRGLPREAHRKIGQIIRYIQINWPVGMPHVRAFGDNLYELRATHESIAYRIMFTVLEDSMFLLNGFIKKTQTTPLRELKIARLRQGEKR